MPLPPDKIAGFAGFRRGLRINRYFLFYRAPDALNNLNHRLEAYVTDDNYIG